MYYENDFNDYTKFYCVYIVTQLLSHSWTLFISNFFLYIFLYKHLCAVI